MLARPNFFLVGHSKSGTSALAQFLGQHPDIAMSQVKEPNYFCPEFCRANLDQHPESAFIPRTEEEYLSLFDHVRDEARVGEASAAYLYSAEAPKLIQAFNPSSRIIMVFREPASFIRSYHLQQVKNPIEEGETARELAEALRLEPARRAGLLIPEGCLLPEFLFYTTDRLQYDTHFDRYAKVFPGDQILALTYEEYLADNVGTLHRIYDFLGVDPSFEPEIGVYNKGGQVLQRRWLMRALNSISHGNGSFRAVKPVVKALFPDRVRQRLIQKAYGRLVFAPAEPVSAEVNELIRRAAQPHVEALGERLDRDLLDEWEYETA